MNFNKNKLNILHKQIMISITLTIGIVFLNLYKGGSQLNLFYLCWFNNVFFLLQIRMLKKMVGTYLNPIVLFSCFLFIFSSGQLVLYSFGISINDFNIFERLDPAILQYSILYLILGYSMYQTGVIYALRNGNVFKNYLIKPKSEPNKIIFTIGLCFFALGIIPYLVALIHSLKIVSTLGYSAYYQEGTRLNNLYTGLGYYTYTGLILIITAGKKYQKQLALLVLVLIAIISLLAGDRGDGMVIILAAYLLYIYFILKRKPRVLPTILLLTFLMTLVPLIGTLRHSATMNSDINLISLLIDSNIIVSTLTNLGGTIWPLTKIIELIPSQQDILWGGSYIVSLLLLIPSFLRIGYLGNIDLVYTSPANWLMKSLDMTYGPGFTPFAESYMNFGWGGILFMAVFGFFVTKLLSIRAKHSKDIPLMMGLSILCFLLLAMGARGSFNYMIAFPIRYALFPFIVIRIVENRYRQATK